MVTPAVLSKTSRGGAVPRAPFADMSPSPPSAVAGLRRARRAAIEGSAESQPTPGPSPSRSHWSMLATVGQLSLALHRPSPSPSPPPPGVQVPDSQVSGSVHAIEPPVSHGSPSGLGGSEHWPVRGSQLPATWHWSSAWHTVDTPAQCPAAQRSLLVQALSSLQGFVLGALTQPRSGSHESSVHGSWWSRLVVGPPTQRRAAHASRVVQASPSSQGAVLATLTQPLAGSQESSVHGL